MIDERNYNEWYHITYLTAPSSCPDVFNVGVEITVELLLLSPLSVLSLLSPFSPFSLCPFLGPRFFGGGAFDMQPWQYHLPRGTCTTNMVVDRPFIYDNESSYLNHWWYVTVVVICSRTYFTINHLSNWLLSMTTANNTFSITSRFVHTLIAVPMKFEPNYAWYQCILKDQFKEM